MLPLLRMAQERSIHQDELGVLIALDDALEAYADTPGLRRDLAALPIPKHPIFPRWNRIDKDEYFHRLKAVMVKHGITPLAGKTIAVVGCYDMRDPDHHNTIDSVRDLCAGATILDLSHQITGQYLTTANAAELSHGVKADYAITCNVINDPGSMKNDTPMPDHPDTIMAVASLVKKGGKAIHMLVYGDPDDGPWIPDPELRRLCGQRMDRNIPNTAYRIDLTEHGTDIFRNQLFTKAMIVDQLREVDLTPEDCELYKTNIAANRNRILEGGGLTPCMLSHGAEAGFNLRQAYDYLSRDMAHMHALQGHSLAELFDSPSGSTDALAEQLAISIREQSRSDEPAAKRGHGR